MLQLPTYEDAPEAAKLLKSRRIKLQREQMLEKDYNILTEKQKDEFIKKAKGNIKCIANFTWNGLEFMLWVSYREGIFYIRQGHSSENNVKNYALTLPDHRPNYMLITSPSKTDIPISIMKNARQNGILYFDNDKLKVAVDTFLKFIV